MKRSLCIAAILLMVVMCAGAQAAPAPGTVNPAPKAVAEAPAIEFSGASSRHYAVWSDSGKDEAKALAKELDGLFDVFNESFRFDEARLKGPLTVRKFSGKDAFDTYLKKTIGETKDDFVYLHYPTVERSELVIFSKGDPVDFAASLAHQAFVQFLKAFIPEPPLWIREGFAVYFERTGLDDKLGMVVYTENQAWLETVKLLKSQSRLYDVSELMTLSAEEARSGLDVFYPESWALVSFFLNSPDSRYNRFIWDAIGRLSPEASLEQNQIIVRDFFLKWHGEAAVQSDFNAYLEGQKTFAELVSSGVRSYGDKDLEMAYKSFSQAALKNPGNYIPPYYLGLIAYAKADYTLADEYYKKAMALGSDVPITNYALGINAYASRRLDEAKAYLEKAMDGDPEKYKEKAGEIIARISGDTP